MNEVSLNHSSQHACNACWSRDRDLFPIAEPSRLHKLLVGAATDVHQFVPSALLVAAMAVCWECRSGVSKIFGFCERVCRAQSGNHSDGDREEKFDYISLSSLDSVIKVGFDLELLHEDNPSNLASSVSPVSVSDSHTTKPIKVTLERPDSQHVQDINEDADMPPHYTSKINNAATVNTRHVIPITSVQTGKMHIAENAREDQLKGSAAERSVPIKKQVAIVTILMNEEDMLRRREEERKAAKYVASRYQCDSCIKGYRFVETLVAHNKKKHNKELNPYHCDICLEHFPFDLDRRLHRESHYLLYACSCGFTHHSYAVAQAHCRVTVPNAGASVEPIKTRAKPKRKPEVQRDYLCTLCNKVFKSRSHLRYHSQARHTAGFPCDACGKALVTRSALKKHCDIVHGADAPLLACAACGLRYRGREALARHRRHVHGAPGPPERRYCVDCGVLYKTSRHYRFHLRTSLKHVDRKSYKHVCEECGKRFWHPGELQSHEAWHCDRSLFQCAICEKRLSNRITLKNHVRFVHEKKTPPRNKVCEVCGNKFNSKSSLENHLRRHTGERPYRCTVCGATFAHSGALYKHNQHKHLKVKRGEAVGEESNAEPGI